MGVFVLSVYTTIAAVCQFGRKTRWSDLIADVRQTRCHTDTRRTSFKRPVPRQSEYLPTEYHLSLPVYRLRQGRSRDSRHADCPVTHPGISLILRSDGSGDCKQTVRTGAAEIRKIRTYCLCTRQLLPSASLVVVTICSNC